MDQNVERMEVVRGAGSALFGSNTPGAIVNLINKTGGPSVRGSFMAYGGTGSLARTDFNINGPVGEDWRFNVGGFYRYKSRRAQSGLPGHRRRAVQGEPHAQLRQRLLPLVAQGDRRS